jgi:hypothetical protein
MATDNIVVNNTAAGNGLAEFLLVGPLTAGDCYEDNPYSSWAVPVWTTGYHTCCNLKLPISFDFAGAMLLLGGQSDAVREVPAGSDYRLWPAPPPQVGMAEPASAPGEPAFEVFVKPDTPAIAIPELPAGTVIRGKEITVSGVPITDPTVWTFIFSLWPYFLALALIEAWMALAIWDIVRRQDEMSKGATVGWYEGYCSYPSSV